MKNIRPLVLHQLDVRLPGLRVRRLRLHRHLAETEDVRSHQHSYSQLLLYLGGRGFQRIGKTAQEQSYPIRPGTAVFLPPHLAHGFTETESRRPLCLVIDLDWRGAGHLPPRVTPLTQIDLSEIRHALAQLGRQERPGAGPDQVRTASIVLQVIDVLWRGMGFAAKSSAPATAPTQPIVTAVKRALLAAPDSLSLEEIAGQLGYQHDYLNRLLKTATGLTLGQIRSQLRVTQAKRYLKEIRRVADVAAKLGFQDANYFARWFRLQSGLTPRQYQLQAV